eukprot:augustus_masked-scaffold_1-processed-gene-29.66-mRNA-1 protein AED:0.20 eAED:0.20 QI:0/-1/0/1/-1/1/1/0/157
MAHSKLMKSIKITTNENNMNEKEKLKDELEVVMSRLLDLGASVATPIDTSPQSKLKRANFDEINVNHLEMWIDKMDESLHPLTNFILPSGGECSAALHVARTVSRRAEREVVPLIDENKVEPSVGKYLNRLSDYLFTAARFISALDQTDEIIYKKEQ